MRKPGFCLSENKGADKLRGDREADQRLCFRYTDSTISVVPKMRNFELLAFHSDSTDRFVSNRVGTPEDRFSRVAALMSLAYLIISVIS